MNKIEFENASVVTPAKVTINGTDYEVTPAQLTTVENYLSAEALNDMQDNIEDAIDLKENKSTVLWTGASKGGNVINLDVSLYTKLTIKVQLSSFITFLEIDLTQQTSGITKDNINYKYGNAIVAGALDGTQYINKCSVAVSSDKLKIIGYDFGYVNLSLSPYNFQNRDDTANWHILEIIGHK